MRIYIKFLLRHLIILIKYLCQTFYYREIINIKHIYISKIYIYSIIVIIFRVNDYFMPNYDKMT